MGQAEDTVMKAHEKMKEVNALLNYHAEKMKCEVNDLQWKVDRGGHIHIREKKDAMRRKEA